MALGDNNIVWIGISMKESSSVAFDERYLSGKILKDIEGEVPYFKHHKINLVDFSPEDENGRIRYPTEQEIFAGKESLIKKIEKLNPVVVVAMGGLVTKTLAKVFNLELSFPKDIKYYFINGQWRFISIHHPAYIAVYKRKLMKEYITQIAITINRIKDNFLEL